MVLYFFNLEQTVVEPRFMFVFTLHFVSFRSFVRSFVLSFAGIRFVLSCSRIVFDILAFWFLFGLRIAFNLT